MRVVILTIVFSTVLAAQSTAPVLTDDQRMRIQNIELKAEVLTLRIVALQGELQKLQAEASTYFATLKQDGYTLERGQDGVWGYAAVKK